KQEQELLALHAFHWAEPLRGLVSEFGFRRGFVEYVAAEDIWQPNFFERIPELFRLAPVQALHLEEYNAETAAGLLAWPQELSRLRSLEVFGLDGIRARELRQLLTSSCLANLATLLLDNEYTDEFPQAALAVLGRSPALSRLTELGLAVGEEPGDLETAV